jgi:Fe-S-cluster containining protein
MRSYAADASELACLCEKCRGKCCMGHYILLSASECIALSKYADFPRKRIDSPTGCAIAALDALSSGKCPFLKPSGCALSEKMRPLVCRMFPMTYTLENGVIKFYLSKKCPYIDDVKKLEDWLKKTKRDGSEELKKTWTSKEIRCFGDYLKKADDELIEL